MVNYTWFPNLRKTQARIETHASPHSTFSAEPKVPLQTKQKISLIEYKYLKSLKFVSQIICHKL